MTRRVLSVLVLILSMSPVAADAAEDGAEVPAEVTLDVAGGQPTLEPDAIPAGATEAEVVEVVDGDTLKVRQFDGEVGGHTETVRLIGIDTPETRDPNDPVECYGAEATDRSRALFPEGGTVWLEQDVSERDQYGRLLRYAWIEADRGGAGYLANERLVREGFAVVSTYPPDVKHVERLTAAQDDATEEQAGLWAECGGADTPLEPAAAPTESVEPSVTDCGAFGSYEEAQDYYAAHPEAAPDLDPNGDGRACEVYFGVDQTTTDETPPDEPTDEPAGGACDPSYPDVCIPPYPPDLDCGQVPYDDIRVVGTDPHGFDGNDNDGLGCES